MYLSSRTRRNNTEFQAISFGAMFIPAIFLFTNHLFQLISRIDSSSNSAQITEEILIQLSIGAILMFIAVFIGNRILLFLAHWTYVFIFGVRHLPISRLQLVKHALYHKLFDRSAITLLSTTVEQTDENTTAQSIFTSHRFSGMIELPMSEVTTQDLESLPITKTHRFREEPCAICPTNPTDTKYEVSFSSMKGTLNEDGTYQRHICEDCLQTMIHSTQTQLAQEYPQKVVSATI